MTQCRIIDLMFAFLICHKEKILVYNLIFYQHLFDDFNSFIFSNVNIQIITIFKCCYIINATRQVGTCLGIAILVTLLNTHIQTAKDQIKKTSINIITQKNISPHVKKVAKKQIKTLFSTSNFSDDDNVKIQRKMNHLKAKIKKAALKEKGVPKPKINSKLRMLYDGSTQIYTSSDKIAQAYQQFEKNAASLTECSKDKNVSKIENNLQLLDGANQKVATAQSFLSTKIALLAQANEMKSGLKDIKEYKNQKMAHAFSQTYIFGSILIIICSPIALWTNRKRI